MYEFIFGFVAGALTGKVVTRKTKDAQVQADDVVITTITKPIIIPTRRNVFVAGELADFWN